jgi:hypothetical protein
MSKQEDLFPMPEPRATVRDGDALVEFTHGGEVVGSFNFSKVIRNWWTALKHPGKERSIEVVR